MNTGHPRTRSSSARTEPLPFAAPVYRAEREDDEGAELEALRTELRNEVRALRGMITRASAPTELAAELAHIRAALDELAPSPKRDRITAWIRARGFDGPAATRLAAVMRKGEGDLAERARAALGELVASAPLPGSGPARAVVAVVGPSGVGKTTTIAKLAARARLAGRSVALVSCDAFRVGAVDQLERYAELLSASFHVARAGGELASVLEDEEADVVFVDTSGRPPGASSPETALTRERRPASIADAAVEIVLCMPAAVRAQDAARIARTFAPLAASSVCVTKIDETDAPSGLLHAPWATKRPLSALCDGPRVPEDLHVASAEEIARRVAAAETKS